MQFNYSPAVQCVGGCNSNIRITEQSCSKNTPLSIYIATLNELVINWDQFLFFFFFKHFRKIAKSDYQLRHVCPSVSVSAWDDVARNGRMYMKFDILLFFKNISTEFNFD